MFRTISTGAFHNTILSTATKRCGVHRTAGSVRFYSSVLPQLTVLPAELPSLPFPLQGGILPLFTPSQLALHYQKHHKAYVDKLNALLPPSSPPSISLDEHKTVESLMMSIHKDPTKSVLFNQAAQHFNHSFFWDCLHPAGTPSAGTSASSKENGKGHHAEGEIRRNVPAEGGPLRLALEKHFKSVEGFMEAFQTAGMNNFGSGWTWLCVDSKGSNPSLVIVNTSNAGCPITSGLRPIFTADVWEHAYYKDFENRRADYLKELWKAVNWMKVEEHYNAALAAM